MTTPARTVFLGSGAFGVPVVDALSRHPAIELVAVVSAPRRLGSHGRAVDPPVAGWADQRGVPMLRPVRLRAPEAVQDIGALAPDMLVLADYGQIVPQALLEMPRFGALNLHPSLLPRHRGATPIPAAILAGDRETGVSLMQMDAGLDTGPIVAQLGQALRGDETAPELERELAQLAARLLAATIEPWLAGAIVPAPQAEGGTVTRPLRRADGRLDPARGADYLARQVRAYQPWPGSYIETPVGRIVVWAARPLADDARTEPGTTVAAPGGGLALSTGSGMLELVEVQPAGGRRMSGAELLRGRPALAGTSIGEAPPAVRGA